MGNVEAMTFSPKTALALAEQLENCDRWASEAPWTEHVWFGSDEGGWAAVGPHHETSGVNYSESDEPGSETHRKALQDAKAIVTLRNLAAECARALREAVQRVAELERGFVSDASYDSMLGTLDAERDQARAECEAMRVENERLRDAATQPPFYREMWLALITEIQVADKPDLQAAALERLKTWRANQPSKWKERADEWHGKYHDADRGTLAKAVLAMLPVIRAVEEWRIHGEGQSHCDEEGCRCTEQLLREAIDQLHSHTKASR